MDVRMPRIDGIQATRLLLEHLADPPRVLVLTTFENDEYVYEALAAGASGFLLKRARPERIAEAVRMVARAALRGRFAVTGTRRARWTSPESAATWGRRATYVAAAIPVLYALTRFAWALGIPLGLPAEAVDDLHDTGAAWAGVGLATFAVVGAILTLGLVQRWGEVFPRWVPALAGRKVPIRLATVPATLVAIFVMSASVGFLTDPIFWDKLTTDTAAVAPMLTWPVWSVALAAATLAYHLRRSPTSGRGTPDSRPMSAEAQGPGGIS
ncbi:response regulator receiver domain-containing protein [Paractinoplanes brasiliensis]|uniref:Response regulator receiver domain-containing protein n=1 Tax=Paractinoplanes brasiliensis TaxID=52695 RepID=A0A4R6J6V7_9ACTN|nr:response regulator receiver domain-containing protein [Actinoplanes brasiliensis]